MTSTLFPTYNASSTIFDGSNVTEAPIAHGYPPEVVIALATFLVLVIILTVIGNGMVILTIIRHKRMRTRTNMFIINLAISDILTALIDMPVSLVTLIEGRWVFPDGMCQFNGFTMVLFLITSIHTLMYISVHKCISITRPFSRFMTPRRILYMIMASWLWSFAYATGALLGWNRSVYKIGATQCGPSYPDDAITKSHSLVNTIFNFLVPLIILSVCYYCTFREIRAHMDRMRETSNVDIGDSKTTAIQQKRIAVTLFMVMTCFLLCLTPYVIYSCIGAFTKDKSKVPTVLNPIAYWCIYANCACNPIIYAFRSPAFRQGYKEIMCGRAMYYISRGSFRSTSQRSWSYRSSVKSTTVSKVDTTVRRASLPNSGRSSREDISKIRSPSVVGQCDIQRWNSGWELNAKNSVGDVSIRKCQREGSHLISSFVNHNNKQHLNSNGTTPTTQIEAPDENNYKTRARISSDISGFETQELGVSTLDTRDIDATIPIQQINAPLTAKFSPPSEDVDENREAIYDSDVEMEHSQESRRHRRRNRRPRGAVRSAVTHRGTVCHLVQAQHELMRSHALTPPREMKRPRSMSNLDRREDDTSKSPSLYHRLRVARNAVTKSAENLQSTSCTSNGSVTTKKLASPLRFFRKSRERSLENITASSNDVQED